ncbi:MAG: Gfo/Idh/MocA family oxidoreductase [Chloroflexota bacterium]|nr:Gfo/Idh/MocA family oxidoreductase [Chloroflexota bacterium]
MGAGFINNVHADVLMREDGVRITAVVDPDVERAATLAAKTGAAVMPSLEALLESGVDAVYIATPNALHAQAALAALAAGVHVFAEKPMATTLADARRVRQAASSARGVYQMGFNRRFAPIYRLLKELIQKGELTPHWAHLKMNRGELHSPPWVADAAVSGGFLYETTIHLLDMSRWLFGEVREVMCRAAQSCYNQLDDFAMLISFASGATATLCSSAHATWLFPFERVEVFGDHATAVTEEMERLTYCSGLGRAAVTHDQAQLPMPARWGYVEEDRLFLAAITGGGQPAVSAEDGYRAVELVEACYRAARTAEPVPLPLE